MTVGDVYEAVGANAAGLMTDKELKQLEDHACPGAGACGGQFTANTMSTVMEFIGLSPMGFNSIPALDPKKDEAAFECGQIVMDLLKRGVKPLDILTRQAFENAIASVAATGGSTNAVLHLLAMAREAGVPLGIEDFDVISSRTPIIADLKPAGRFVAVDVHHAGGIPLIAQKLLHPCGPAKRRSLPLRHPRLSNAGHGRSRARQGDQRRSGHPDTVLVMLTSVGHLGALRHQEGASVDACLSKPVRQSQLLTTLATAWSKKQHVALASPARPGSRIVEMQSALAGRSAGWPIRVLVAEDNVVNQKVAVRMLERLRLQRTWRPTGARR